MSVVVLIFTLITLALLAAGGLLILAARTFRYEDESDWPTYT